MSVRRVAKNSACKDLTRIGKIPTKNLVTQFDKITVRSPDETYGQQLPRKSSKNRLDPIAGRPTTKENERLLSSNNVYRNKHARHIQRDDKKRVPSTPKTTSGRDRAKLKNLKRFYEFTKIFDRYRITNFNGRNEFSSLPYLNEYQEDDKVNVRLIKHSYSWPSLQQSDRLKVCVPTTGDNFRKCAKQTMGKTFDTSKCKRDAHQPRKVNDNELYDANQNERSSKHREKTPEKSKTRRKENSKERYPNNRPKPPSWQNFTVVEVPPDNGRSKLDLSSVNRSKLRIEAKDKRLRSNIHRTHSMVIDASEMPEASNLVIPLAEGKPHEIRLLRGSEFDDILYMAENEQRCRDWLKTLESAECKHHSSTSTTAEKILPNTDTVTCDLELAEDRWDFLISPYPKKGKPNL
ncbi:uncharacterized protein [Antedon mediterranea]|uniref:uncharacterized protein n=1 Tax=Antedon mediterranea TaxID=105859 RepID=UPI003AF89EE9